MAAKLCLTNARLKNQAASRMEDHQGTLNAVGGKWDHITAVLKGSNKTVLLQCQRIAKDQNPKDDQLCQVETSLLSDDTG